MDLPPVASVSSTFKAKYRNDRVAFVHDCIRFKEDQGPTFYQDEILDALSSHSRVCTRGPHGLGKTTLNSWLILHFALTSDGEDWKCPTTAGAWRQLEKFLWPEVRKWARAIRWDVVGRDSFKADELQLLSLRLGTGEAFAVASDNPELIEGAHAERLLYIFDESKAVREETFDAAEGAFSNAGGDTTNEAYAVAMSTPGEPFGRFYDIQSRKPGYEDWWVRAVKLEECIKAGRISNDWVEARRKQWGEESAIFKNRVLGEFASQDEQGIVPLSWVEAATERWYVLRDSGQLTTMPTNAVGVDVGDQGDETVFAFRSGQTIVALQRFAKQDTMQTTGKLYGYVQDKACKAVIDVIGIGAGVVARLRELKTEAMIKNQRPTYEVIPFHAAEKSERKDLSGEMGFINLRAEAWWHMRERLDPSNGSTVALPPDDKLTGDLVAPRYLVTSRGEYQIEKKAEIKKRLGRSTDTGDAVIMAFYEPQQTRSFIPAVGGKRPITAGPIRGPIGGGFRP